MGKASDLCDGKCTLQGLEMLVHLVTCVEACCLHLKFEVQAKIVAQQAMWGDVHMMIESVHIPKGLSKNSPNLLP